MIQFLTQPPSQQQDLLFGPPPPEASEMGTRRGSTQYNGSPAWRVGGGGFAPKRTARAQESTNLSWKLTFWFPRGANADQKGIFESPENLHFWLRCSAQKISFNTHYDLLKLPRGPNLPLGPRE